MTGISAGVQGQALQRLGSYTYDAQGRGVLSVKVGPKTVHKASRTNAASNRSSSARVRHAYCRRGSAYPAYCGPAPK
jgi:hypothetical protein